MSLEALVRNQVARSIASYGTSVTLRHTAPGAFDVATGGTGTTVTSDDVVMAMISEARASNSRGGEEMIETRSKNVAIAAGSISSPISMTDKVIIDGAAYSILSIDVAKIRETITAYTLKVRL